MSEPPTGSIEPVDPVDPVDPLDPGQVADVVAGTQRLMGYDGVLDLLTRLPGVSVTPGSPKRMFHPAVEGVLTLGDEHRLSLSEPVVHQHVVGGVTLARSVVAPGEVAPLVAGLLTALTRAQGSHQDSSAVLTAAREVQQTL